jgi:hypothetical protein
MLALSANRMISSASPPQAIPAGVRIAAGVFFLAWAPTYWHFWGPTNVLFLCDIAVILSSVGFVIQSPLLLSSQAVSLTVVSLFWTLDVCWHLLFGRNLIGGTDYMFDERYPLWLRLISLYHIVLPVLLIWALSRRGYDRRGFRLQCAIAAIAVLGARGANSGLNINFAFVAPFFHRQLGPAPVHLTLTFLAIATFLYLPPHLIFRKVFSSSES